MPASSNARSSSFPAGPTNGRPSRSSRLPGCSPTNITSAPGAPSPKTAWVARSQMSHPRHSCTASARSFNEASGSIKSLGAGRIGFLRGIHAPRRLDGVRRCLHRCQTRWSDLRRRGRRELGEIGKIELRLDPGNLHDRVLEAVVTELPALDVFKLVTHIVVAA